MSYKAVIFDLDTTLIRLDSDFKYTIVGTILKDIGIINCYEEVYSLRNSVDKFWFGPQRDTVIKEEFNLDPDLFWRLYEKYDTVGLRRQFVEPYYDVNFISQLRAKRYKTGIVTLAPKHITDYEVRILGQRFDSVVSAHFNGGIKSKPDPEGLIACLGELNVYNNEAVFVGDSDEDLLAAKRANIDFIHIMRKEELRQRRDLNEIPFLCVYNLYTIWKLIE